MTFLRSFKITREYACVCWGVEIEEGRGRECILGIWMQEAIRGQVGRQLTPVPEWGQGGDAGAVALQLLGILENPSEEMWWHPWFGELPMRL